MCEYLGRTGYFIPILHYHLVENLHISKQMREQTVFVMNDGKRI